MICLYFPVRRSSAMMSRMKSEGLSVSVVIVESKAIANVQIDNSRAEGWVWGAHASRVLAIASRDRELCLNSCTAGDAERT